MLTFCFFVFWKITQNTWLCTIRHIQWRFVFMLPNLHSNRLKSEIKGTKMWMGVVYAYINICMYMIKDNLWFYCMQLLENIVTLKIWLLISIGFKSLFSKIFWDFSTWLFYYRISRASKWIKTRDAISLKLLWFIVFS